MKQPTQKDLSFQEEQDGILQPENIHIPVDNQNQTTL